MILPGVTIRRPEGADGVDLSDLTDSVRTRPACWAEGELDTLVMPLDPEPSEAEATAIRRRLATVDAADEAWLYSLLDLTPASPFEERWLAAELAKYGETT